MKPHWTNGHSELHLADARAIPLPDGSVHCAVTSPPYWGLRSYGLGDSGIGNEPTLQAWVENIVAVSREVRRVLRDDGTYFINLGDAYWGGKGMSGGPSSDSSDGRATLNKSHTNMGGKGRMRGADGKHETLKPKDLMGQPWRVAFALQDDGWFLRSAIVWAKPNPMPESVTDRPTSAYEMVFLLTKKPKYFYDAEAVRTETNRFIEHPMRNQADGNRYAEPARGVSCTDKQEIGGANLRNVWDIEEVLPIPMPPAWTIAQIAKSPTEIPVVLVSEYGHGIACIVSPDCPLHAGQPDWVPNGFYDGLANADVNYIQDKLRRVQAQADDSFAIGLNPVQDSSHPSKTDLPPRSCSPAATGHNTESHKTARDSVSSEHAKLSDQMSLDIEHTGLELPQTVSTCRGIGENKTGEDTIDPLRSLPQTSDGSARIPQSASSLDTPCICTLYRKVRNVDTHIGTLADTWSIPTQGRPEAHFATFADELPRRCILAGTSEHGVCGECGAPWVRVVEKSFEKSQETHNPRQDGGDDNSKSNNFAKDGYGPGKWNTQTLGFQPTCDHDAARVPATVLDPFVGSGTTVAVAQTLGRKGIGLDLNAEYLEIAERTIGAVTLPMLL